MSDPITPEDVLLAHEALQGSPRLSGLGIGPLTWWPAVGAACSIHGTLERYVESFEGKPDDIAITCVMCLRFGIVRKCPILGWERIHPHLL